TATAAPKSPCRAGGGKASPRRGGEGRQRSVPAGTATPQSRGRAGKGTQHPAPAGMAAPHSPRRPGEETQLLAPAGMAIPHGCSWRVGR
uniref:Uncharacterized protein n=1 Tax=Gopherus agassizii TaxID=38772 RepID=A0A452I6N2_9SAUR